MTIHDIDTEPQGEWTVDDLDIYALGIVYLSVCVPDEMPDDQIRLLTNIKEHCGTKHGWDISSDPTFRSGEPNPSPCPDKQGRKHVLIAC